MAPRNDVALNLALQHVVGELACGKRAGFRSDCELVERDIRHADRSGEAFRPEASEFGHRHFQIHARVRGVKIEKIQIISAEPPEAFLDFPADPFWAAVDALLPPRLPVNPAFSGDEQFVSAAVTDGRADRPLTLPRLAVTIGRVEVENAGVEGSRHGGYGDIARDALARHAGERPATEPEGGDVEPTAAERAGSRVHRISDPVGGRSQYAPGDPGSGRPGGTPQPVRRRLSGKAGSNGGSRRWCDRAGLRGVCFRGR